MTILTNINSPDRNNGSQNPLRFNAIRYYEYSTNKKMIVMMNCFLISICYRHMMQIEDKEVLLSPYIKQLIGFWLKHTGSADECRYFWRSCIDLDCSLVLHPFLLKKCM